MRLIILLLLFSTIVLAQRSDYSSSARLIPLDDYIKNTKQKVENLSYNQLVIKGNDTLVFIFTSKEAARRGTISLDLYMKLSGRGKEDVKQQLLTVKGDSLYVNIAHKKPDGIERRVPLDEYLTITGMSSSELQQEQLIIENNDTLVRSVFIIDSEEYRIKDNRKIRRVEFDYRDEHFLDMYKQTAFSKSNESNHDNARMRYWKKPLLVYFDKEVPPKEKRLITKNLKTIAKEVDSLSIKFVKNLKNSNYIVYTSSSFNYLNNLSGSKKTEYYVNWLGGEIAKAYVRINLETETNESLRMARTQQMIFRSLGFFQKIKNLDCKHLLGSCSPSSLTPTSLDMSILKYHYSYGICKGITLKEFNDFHSKAAIFKKLNLPYYSSHYLD